MPFPREFAPHSQANYWAFGALGTPGAEIPGFGAPLGEPGAPGAPGLGIPGAPGAGAVPAGPPSFGIGAPHDLHTSFVDGFAVPQFGHITGKTALFGLKHISTNSFDENPRCSPPKRNCKYL